MIARLLISDQLDIRVGEIKKILSGENFSNPHPDLLYFPADSKLGIEQARQIKEHFSFKPYQAKGRVVILEDATSLTLEAQNALLKTLEELPEHALFILAAQSEDKLLPTVVSRCQIIRHPEDPEVSTQPTPGVGYDIEKLLKSTIEERFEYIEKLKMRKEFLTALVHYFHEDLNVHPGRINVKFIKELLQGEEWAAQNVNIRAILEYLMLVMPQI